MSETDDTDVLLLIPPNLFSVKSSDSEESLLDSSRTVLHKPPSCTAQVLGKLVSQVHTLESRLENLELSTTCETVSSFEPRNRNTSWDSDSFCRTDQKSFTFPRRRRRKLKRKPQDVSMTSIESVTTFRSSIPSLKLEKHRIKNRLTQSNENINELATMDDVSSIVSTPNKKNDKLLLHEIDEFLTKVEAYEGPEHKSKDSDVIGPENVIKAAGDYIQHKYDTKTPGEIQLPSGRMIANDILDKYIYLVKNNGALTSNTDKNIPSESSYNSQCKHESLPNTTQVQNPKVTNEMSKPSQDKTPSVRKLNFSDKDVQPTSTPKQLPQTSLDSFRPSSNKIYDRASKVLEQYNKSLNPTFSSKNSSTNHGQYSPKKEEFKIPKMKPYMPESKDFKMPQMRPYISDNKEVQKLAAMQDKYMDTIDTDLLSLSELWGEKENKGNKSDSGRLEEERLKREHCEAVIQQLQKKILEQQEKLAVAVKVDRAKDSAIVKLKEAWQKLTSSLDKTEDRHQTEINKMLQEVEYYRNLAHDDQRKSSHFEGELYKALDLAHDYQEKCKQLISEKRALQESTEKAVAAKDEEIKNKEHEITVMKENYETVMRLNKQSTDCVKNLEETLGKERTEHEMTRSQVNELNRRLQCVSEESSLVKQERDILKDKVNEERARCNIIERQLCEKQNQCSELFKKCDSLDSEVKTLRKHLELQKSELKSHYQQQLEQAVVGKLQEFQKQLDAAERDMQEDARNKESAIVDTFNKQISVIEEQHKLEINVLEEKHREEIKLYRLQLAQSAEKISLLEGKLESHRARRSEIASQLHGVMQAQWRQALSILTDRAPSRDHSVLDTVPSPVPRDRLHRGHSAGTLPLEELGNHELKHYVKLLLSKPPNLDNSLDSTARDVELHEEPTSDRPEKQEKKDKPKRSLSTSKPPWKA